MNRPKVRFSQISENQNELKETDEAKDNRNVGKIKIKSIVPTHFPIKVLKNDSSKTVSNSIPSIYVSQESKTPKESDSTSLTLNTTKDTIFTKDEAVLTKSEKTTDQSEVLDCISKLQALNITDEINKPNLGQNEEKIKNIPCITCSDSDENNEVEVIKVVKYSSKSNHIITNHKQSKDITTLNSRKRNENIQTLGIHDQHTAFKGTNKSKRLQKENKENKDENLKKYHNNILPVQRTPAILNDATNLTGKNIKKLRKLEVMPCAKYRLNSVSNQKYNEKLSKNQVKKSAVFNVSGKCPNISVQPGMSHNYKMAHSSVINDSDCRPKDLLSQPIYNSSTYTMKKMKKIEQEKLIADFEHLSQANKNFINSKVSAALDFGPYESVYKDLINLSVEEDKLPPTLMRSKDPEPRDKDFIPELSDFYHPKSMEQNFVIADPIILNPVNVNTLSAFTISNKICTWRN